MTMSKFNLESSDKRIGKVLFIVEGTKTEMNILKYIFTHIFDYQCEKLDRIDRYKPYNKKTNPHSSIFVVNTRESNINDILDQDGYLEDIFIRLNNEYGFKVDRTAIFYIFDRDNHSNTNKAIIEELLYRLNNSRESNENNNYRQGLLLLSYPSIESFTASNYIKDSFEVEIDTGAHLKQYLHSKKIAYQKINTDTLKLAIKELDRALKLMEITEYNLDDFSDMNIKVYNYEEQIYQKNKRYKLLSSMCLALMDLGLITIEE